METENGYFIPQDLLWVQTLNSSHGILKLTIMDCMFSLETDSYLRACNEKNKTIVLFLLQWRLMASRIVKFHAPLLVAVK